MSTEPSKPGKTFQEAWMNFKGGDFASLGILFEIHYQELFYYGIKIIAIPELVKDTIQDLFADVLKYRARMASVENFKAYLILYCSKKHPKI